MTEHPIMALLLQHNSFLGKSEDVEERIVPIDAQLNFGPGDAAVLAQADTPLEEQLTFVRCVDPAKHAETFPDWEERVMMKAHVLCEIFSATDRQVTLGWVHRIKLLPISGYRYRQARRWLKKGWPEELPDWVAQAYLRYTDQLHQQAPDVVPRAAACKKCGSRNVDLVVVRTIEYRGRVGSLLIKGEERFIPVADAEGESTHKARLECTKCRTTVTLSDEQWHLPGHSS